MSNCPQSPSPLLRLAKRTHLPALALAALSALAVTPLSGGELTLASVTPPAPNRADEPLAESFSMAGAVHFLDRAALDWTSSRKCFTCHTNYAYLLARPEVSASATAHRQVRTALEAMVTDRWPDKGPRWDAEVVMTAAVLALNDSATTGKLHATTRQALNRMWTVQRDDGGFDWLKCDWPPMESDDYFGATMAALAVGAAPEAYCQTEVAQAGCKRLQSYFAANPPPTLHHTAMLLWADSLAIDILTDEQRTDARRQLLQRQQDDGGWSLPSLGDWKRADGSPQAAKTSDGYGTGFVIHILRQAGMPAGDPRIQKGINWLKANQRTSGRWFTRSLHKDSRHFISHAGTAFAVMALTSCGEQAEDREGGPE